MVEDITLMWRLYLLALAFGLAFAVGLIFFTIGVPAGEVL
jgi:hypothetical protein